MSSGSVPATLAAVACVKAAAAPDVTIAPSLPSSSAMRAPAFSISSSMSTACTAARPLASRTSGRDKAPPLIVSVPVRLMNGRTPIRV